LALVRLINVISLLKNWRTNEFKGLDIKTTSVRAFDNKSEVLTEVPAYQYSSAILFPETRTKLPKDMTALNHHLFLMMMKMLMIMKRRMLIQVPMMIILKMIQVRVW
jgi:hypothetical protein